MAIGNLVQWITGLFAAVILVTIIISVRAWRDAKRSPFYFMRQEAQKRMQTAAIASISLAVVYMGLVTYLQQSSLTVTLPRYALIQNAKPAKVSLNITSEDSSEATVVDASTITRTSIQADISEEETALTADLTSVPLELPDNYDQFEPAVPLTADTQLGEISFSTRINDDFEAVGAQRVFEEGYFTIYATFAYEKMADGMEWAWVWRHNGNVVAGGNELWAYRDVGPGYIFLQPEEGFLSGSYDLQVWVNGELLTDASFFVTSGIAANQ